MPRRRNRPRSHRPGCFPPASARHYGRWWGHFRETGRFVTSEVGPRLQAGTAIEPWRLPRRRTSVQHLSKVSIGMIRALCACAIVALLWHVTTNAQASVGPADQPTASASHLQGANAHDRGDCAQGKHSCCGVACFVTLPASVSQVASVAVCKRPAFLTSAAISGIVPESPQRPPKYS